MSTTQSHIQTGPQNAFNNFNPQQRLTQMNARPEVIRQPGVPQLPQMVMQNRQQSEQQHGQPLMAMISNSNNPPMNIFGGGPPGNNSAQLTQARYQQQFQQAEQQRQQQRLLQQAQNAQSSNASVGGTSGPPMAGLGPNQIGFPGNLMQQQASNNPQVRRAQSQPQPLNQLAGHLPMGGGAIHPGQQGGGAMPMGMNAQTSMPAQLRQAAQQQINNLRMQQIPGQGQGQMSPEMVMAMRQQGNPGMPPNSQRSSSAQTPLMNGQQQGLPQSQSLSVGMQPNNFPTPMSHPNQQSQTTSPSPRLGSRSQPQTPANLNIANPGQTQSHVNRSQSDMFNFQNPQFPQVMPNNAGRTSSSQFPFVPSSTSPNHHSDISQSMGTLGSNNRPGGFLTPAQQLQSGEGYTGQFNMPPPQSNVPPRPPSNNNSHPPLIQHQQQSPHHLSSQQQDHLAGHPLQRPQSQPQNQTGRPPSQSGPPNTPRTSHSQISSLLPAGRISSLSQQGGPQVLHQPQSASGHPLPIAPRPPPPMSAVAGSSSAAPAAFPSSEGGPSQGSGIPQRLGNVGGYPLGVGQGLTRLLQFSGILASDNKGRLSLAYWDALVKEYFASQAIMKFTLWKDNQRNEAKPFDIGVPILPRFFLVTAQSGVKSMTLSLDGARERLVSPNHAIIECVTAAWTYKYTNGYTVTLRGPLTAHVILVPNTPRGQGSVAQSSQPFSLKFENLEFGANFHDKSISLESIMGHRNPELSPPKTPHTRNAPTPTANGTTPLTSEDDKKWEEPRVIIDRASIPGEPVNAFGIPQATMRCLELAESVGQMTDLIVFADQVRKGPIEGLKLYAAKLRESGSVNPGQGLMNVPASGSSGFQHSQALNGANVSPAVTLYSTVPPSANTPSTSQPTPSTPQNTPSSASNSPRKQHKTVPQPAGPALTSAQSSSSGSGTSAPTNASSMPNTALKRKQTDTASPGTSSDQPPPAKRTTRKRGRGAGG